jgi:hypothetical protein
VGKLGVPVILLGMPHDTGHQSPGQQVQQKLDVLGEMGILIHAFYLFSKTTGIKIISWQSGANNAGLYVKKQKPGISASKRAQVLTPL